jgi:hypothetical protein
MMLLRPLSARSIVIRQPDQHRIRRLAAMFVAAVAVVAVLPIGAVADAASGPIGGQFWRPKPQPTATATTAPSPSTTATSVSVLPAPTGGCAFPTIAFNGASYCPASIADVRSTVYGTGTRVVVRSVTVTAVTASSVTVAAWALPPCTPGNFCGATLALQSLTATWSGTTRPAYGDVLDLFGVTIAASMSPNGFITTGNCPIEYC